MDKVFVTTNRGDEIQFAIVWDGTLLTFRFEKKERWEFVSYSKPFHSNPNLIYEILEELKKDDKVQVHMNRLGIDFDNVLMFKLPKG